MQSNDLRIRIDELIPSMGEEPQQKKIREQLQSFYIELLKDSPNVLKDADLNFLEIPILAKCTLTPEEFLGILTDIEKQGMLKDWYVPAYLASLAQTIGTEIENQAFQWVRANNYIMWQLVDKNFPNIKMLCMRFRLAHRLESKYFWI